MLKGRMKVTKALCQRIHAKNRASCRYGIKLNRFDRKSIVQKIRNGDCQLVEKQSNRVFIYNLTYNEIPIQIVFDSQRGEIVSFLPPSNLLRDQYATREQLESLGLLSTEEDESSYFVDSKRYMEGESK